VPIKSRIWNSPVVTALIIGLGLRIFLALATPVGGASVPGRISSYDDELAHAQYAMYIIQNSALPTHVEAIDAESALLHGQYENYQPPLYYSMLALLAEMLGCADHTSLIVLGRFLGLVFFTGILCVFVLLGQQISAEPLVVSGGLIFLALNGVMVRFTSTVGNDPLFWLAAGGMLLFTARIHRHPGSWKEWVGILLCGVVGVYAKLTTLVVLPILLIESLAIRTRRAWVNTLIVLLLIFVCSFPVWQRNIHEFGSAVPLAAGFGQPVWRIPTLTSLVFTVRSFVFPWTEFWKGLTGAALMLPVLYVLARGAILKSGWRTLIAWKFLGVFIISSAAAFLWLNLHYNQAESRYLFAAWPALTFLGIGKRITMRGLWLLLIVLLLPYILFILP
jgi:hypothetical protein